MTAARSWRTAGQTSEKRGSGAFRRGAQVTRLDDVSDDEAVLGLAAPQSRTLVVRREPRVQRAVRNSSEHTGPRRVDDRADERSRLDHKDTPFDRRPKDGELAVQRVEIPADSRVWLTLSHRQYFKADS